MGIVMIFITLANVTVQSGFSTALIQKKNSDETDFSSVFCFGLVPCGGDVRGAVFRGSGHRPVLQTMCWSPSCGCWRSFCFPVP